MKKHFVKVLSVAVIVVCLLASCGSEMYTVSTQLNEPVYVRPASPGPGYIWVSGDWVRSRGSYNWREGYWAQPRRSRAYVSGSWQPRRNGYYWQRGHWR